MILSCPRCSSQFAVPRELIGPQGRKVQCSSCQFVWKANAGLSSVDQVSADQAQDEGGFPAQMAAVPQAPVPQAPVPQVPAPPPIPVAGLPVPPQAGAPQATPTQAASPQPASAQAAPAQAAPAQAAPEQPGVQFPGAAPPDPASPNPGAENAQAPPPAGPAPAQTPTEGEKEELEETIPDFLSSFADGGPPGDTPQQAENQAAGAPPMLGNLDGPQAGGPTDSDDNVGMPDIDSIDEEIFSQPEERPVKTVKKGPIAAWIVLLFLISTTLGVMLVERESLIASYPGLNGLYNLVGLGDTSLAYGISFGPTETSIQIQAGQPRTLFIEGTLTNTREDIAPSPFIKGTLYNSRRENLKTWFFKPEKTSILPGEEISYNTSLVDPPRGVTEINVTLASEEEAAAFAEGAEPEPVSQEQPEE